MIKPLLVLPHQNMICKTFFRQTLLGPLGHRTGSVRHGQTTRWEPGHTGWVPKRQHVYGHVVTIDHSAILQPRKSGPLHRLQRWAAQPIESMHEMRCNRVGGSKHCMPLQQNSSTSPSPTCWETAFQNWRVARLKTKTVAQDGHESGLQDASRQKRHPETCCTWELCVSKLRLNLWISLALAL